MSAASTADALAVETSTARELVRHGLWWIAALLLLVVLFAGGAYGVYEYAKATGRVPGDQLLQAQLALATYIRLIVAAALAPQLTLAVLLYGFVGRRFSRPVPALLACVAVGFAPVIPLLATGVGGRMPALQMAGVYQYGSTFALSSLGCFAALWLVGWALRVVRKR